MTESDIIQDFRNILQWYPNHRYQAYFSLASDRYGDMAPPRDIIMSEVRKYRASINLKTTNRSVVALNGDRTPLLKRIKNPALRKPIAPNVSTVNLPADKPIKVDKVSAFRAGANIYRLVLDFEGI